MAVPAIPSSTSFSISGRKSSLGRRYDETDYGTPAAGRTFDFVTNSTIAVLYAFSTAHQPSPTFHRLSWLTGYGWQANL